MDADKKTEDGKEKQETPAAGAGANAPAADALTTPAEGESKESAKSSDAGSGKTPKEPSSLKQTLKRFWLYIVVVLLVAVIGGIFAVVSSLNGRKTPSPPSTESQPLTQSQLKQLSASGTAVNGETLTIQGNAVLDGQELIKGNLYVAGDVTTGGTLAIPGLTISGNGTLGNAQANTLQVANAAAFQGLVTMQNGLNLNGNTSISSVSVGTLTNTKLVLAGNNSVITAPHHITFTGAFPHRTISFGVLGNGGSASVNGSDTNGTVSINTGNNPQPGCFISVIFLIPFARTPNILLGPIGLGAGAIQYSAQPLVDSDGNPAGTGFKICTANTPLPNQAFAFSYLVNGAPD